MKLETLQQTLTAYQPDEILTRTDYFAVVRATRTADSQPVLLLVLDPDLPRDAYFVRRFKDMAARNMRLDHPHILPTLAVEDADGWLLCVLEFPGGQLLETYLQSHVPLSAAETVSLVRQLATALDYAHGQAVRHGGLSAQTIFWDGEHASVAFFGLAQLLEEVAPVAKGEHIAENGYLSPERLAGESPSRTGDLYALGVLTYRMLTGKMPFPAADPDARREPPAPPHTLNPRVRPAVSEVVLRMLSRGVELRQTTGAEFVRALQVATEGSAPMRPITAATVPIKLPPAVSPSVRISGKHIALIAVAGVVVVLALAGGFRLITNWAARQPSAGAKLPVPTATIAPAAVTAALPPTAPPTAAPSPTPNISPTETPVPAPTPAVTPAATAVAAVAADSPFSRLVTATGISDDFKPVNPGTVFNTDTKTVYLFFHYAGMQPGTPWQVEWRFNGSTVETGSDAWNADYGSVGTAWVFYTPIDGFEAGQYTVLLGVKHTTVATATFEMR